MITFDDRNAVTIQNPPTGKAILFYDEDVLKLKDENGDIRIVTLADSIENAVSSGDYYSNSYVERLKALGSPVQYSNYLGGGSVSSAGLLDGQLYITSVFIPKQSIITNIGWRVGTTQGNYTADEYNGIGIYSMNNSTGDLTLLGKTANDATIWSSFATTTYGNKDFESPITLEKGIYFLVYLHNNSAQVTVPSLATHNLSFSIFSNINTTNLPLNTYLCGYVTAPNIILPTTILSAAVTKIAVSDPIYYLS